MFLEYCIFLFSITNFHSSYSIDTRDKDKLDPSPALRVYGVGRDTARYYSPMYAGAQGRAPTKAFLGRRVRNQERFSRKGGV